MHNTYTLLRAVRKDIKDRGSPNWDTIADKFPPDVSLKSIKKHYNRFTHTSLSIWNSTTYNQLQTLVKEASLPISWLNIARKISRICSKKISALDCNYAYNHRPIHLVSYNPTDTTLATAETTTCVPLATSKSLENTNALLNQPTSLTQKNTKSTSKEDPWPIEQSNQLRTLVATTPLNGSSKNWQFILEKMKSSFSKNTFSTHSIRSHYARLMNKINLWNDNTYNKLIELARKSLNPNWEKIATDINALDEGTTLKLTAKDCEMVYLLPPEHLQTTTTNSKENSEELNMKTELLTLVMTIFDPNTFLPNWEEITKTMNEKYSKSFSEDQWMSLYIESDISLLFPASSSDDKQEESYAILPPTPDQNSTCNTPSSSSDTLVVDKPSVPIQKRTKSTSKQPNWSEEESNQLMTLIGTSESKKDRGSWATICSTMRKLFPEKSFTTNSIRFHYKRLMNKKNRF